MNKLVADCATGPAASEHGFIPIQPLLTDFAETGLNHQQHWLPIPAGFSDTHAEEYSQAFSAETRTHVVTVRVRSLFSAQLYLGPLATCHGCVRHSLHPRPAVASTVRSSVLTKSLAD